MGACEGGIDKRYKRIEELRSKFPEYHREDGKLKGYTYDQKDEEALIEYWKRFTSKKDELSKSNPKLFYVLFNRNDQDSKRFTYEGLKTDDEEKFYFFFNKRRFEELNLSESILVFPRFSYQQFPYYKDEKSLLTSINIKSSTILFDGLLPWYQKLESLQYLSLSYNNITNIPENFSSFQNLKELNLRRNKLSNLPKTFEKMNNLVNVDLSENEFTTCPKELFVKSEGESKLQKLNMSSNQLQLFEIPGLDQNESLKYLFLSDNKIQKLPNDIKKLKGLLFVNLDDNLIKDCDFR